MRPAHSRFLTIISGILVLAFVTLSAHAQAFATDESIFGESILLNFDQSNGSFPSALVRDSAGNLYGTTMAGGDPLNGPQLGTAFETPASENQRRKLAGDNPVEFWQRYRRLGPSGGLGAGRQW